MESRAVGNQSALSRLLEEISWEGRSVRRYRDGGRGLENVLTTEVFTALDFLPRQAFLGAVVDAAHGADEARRVLSREVEQAVITVLPTEVKLNPDGLTRAELMIVQPDAMITSSSCRTLVEAKRIRRSSFQPQQLAREYLAVTRPADQRAPLLLLVLGAAPPVSIAGHGRMTIEDAISQLLPDVHSRAGPHPLPLTELFDRIAEVYAWITWHELSDIVSEQQTHPMAANPSVAASIARLATSITNSVDRHC